MRRDPTANSALFHLERPARSMPARTTKGEERDTHAAQQRTTLLQLGDPGWQVLHDEEALLADVARFVHAITSAERIP